MENTNRTKLMWASFLTLIASGVGFATRAASGGIWEQQFGIDGGQFGQIMGAGFLGFAVMIFFGGILVERIGYKKLLVAAFVMHLASAVMLLMAPSLFEQWREADSESAGTKVFNLIYWSCFLVSICQGLYEAVINPLIAQVYPENKTHYLNILHAGWPGGMIIGGLLAACCLGSADSVWITPVAWQYILSSFVVFVIAYAVLAFPEKMPATVSAGSSDFGRVFACFLSLPFLLLIVLHGLIGYMELGVDSWVTKIMANVLERPVLILVYTSALMFILRFFAGPIVHRLNPIGLLFLSSVIACGGLLWLGSGLHSIGMIFVVVTVYSLGKAFLWPTMLAVAGERYPESGAVAMGAMGAAGMLTVGLIAGSAIGHKQGYNMSKNLQDTSAETFERYAAEDETDYMGFKYRSMQAARLNAANAIRIDQDGKLVSLTPITEAPLLSDEEKTLLSEHAETDVPAVQKSYMHGGLRALTLTAYVPAAMALGFLILLGYYRSQGGYKVIHLDESGNAITESSAASAESA